MKQAKLVYQNSVYVKVLFWTSLIILSIVTAYVVETFFYHSFRFNNNRTTLDDVTIETKNLEVDGNRYRVIRPGGEIIFSFPEKVFINELVVETTSEDGPFKYEPVYIEDYDIREYNQFPSFENSVKTIVVNGNVSQVEFYIKSGVGKTFTLDLVDIVYDLNTNYLRLAVLAVMAFVLFYLIASIWLGYSKKVQALALVLSFGLIFAVLIPPNYDNFTKNEYYRPYLLTQGNFTASHGETVVLPSGFESLDQSYRSYDDYMRYLSEQSIRDPVPYETQIAAPFGTSFLAYLPSAVMSFIGTHLDFNFYTILLMERVLNALIYAGLIFFAVALYPGRKLLFLSLASLSGLMFYTSAPGSIALITGSLFLSLSLLARVRRKKSYLTLGFLCFFTLIVASYSFYTSPFVLILLLVPKEYFGKLYPFYLALIIVIAAVLFTILVLYANSGYPIEQSAYATFVQYPLFFITRFFRYLRDEFFTFEGFNGATGLGIIQENFGVFRYFTPLFLILIAFSGKNRPVYDDALSRIVLICTAAFMLSSYLIVAFLRNLLPTGNYFTIEFLALPALIYAIVLPCLQNRKFYLKTGAVFDDLMVIYSYLMLYCDVTILLRMFYA